jgi:hypothetical protein
MSLTLSAIKWAPTQIDALPPAAANPDSIALDALQRKWWNTKWWRDQGFPNPDQPGGMQWRYLKHVAEEFGKIIDDSWPLAAKLRQMAAKSENGPGRWVGPHVAAVIASVNGTLGGAFPESFFVTTGDPKYDRAAHRLADDAYRDCWGTNDSIPLDHPPYFGSEQQAKFAEGFLRVAALYHDIGKTISDDRHVSRGVHVIVDLDRSNRRDMESFFRDSWNTRCFLALLKHHDVYGCLCTGEASLPALGDMISWTSSIEMEPASGRSALAQFSFLNWLNIADSDASLLQYLGGITTVEANRYLQDWKLVTDFIKKRLEFKQPAKRAEFTEWAITEASRGDSTIRRIARLVATCFRTVTGWIDSQRESEIQTLVEEELQALHGPRFQKFARRFTRFVKLDYALRFFYVLMDGALDDQGLTSRDQRQSKDAPELSPALRRMVSWTCAILDRIVAEYGRLVEGEVPAAVRLGVDMSKLMTPNETGKAIRDALRSASGAAGAHRWIVDETSVWLYGD